MAKNIIDKIWDAHVVSEQEGCPAILAIDLMLIHEVTSAQAFQALAEKGIGIYDTSSLVATLDHSIPTRDNRHEIFDEHARKQVATLRSNCEKYKVPLYDFDSGYQGIVHVIGPELGLTQPGMTIVCGDSHTATHGAFGALAFGVGTTEVGHVLAAGAILQRKPKTMKVHFAGRFRKGVSAKDGILKLISQVGVNGGTGYVAEYVGEAISAMTMEERMTVCNMSIEWGARAGLVSPDKTCLDYIRGRKFAPLPESWDAAAAEWLSLASHHDAAYDREVHIDVSNLSPFVTWGTNPAQGVGVDDTVPLVESLPEGERQSAIAALSYTKLSPGQPMAGVPIQVAFVGSCTNGRIEDLRVAAQVLRGRKVSPNVKMYIVPGSEAVRAAAIAEGLAEIFVSAGASFRQPGCSMCLGMNDDRVAPGERAISTSNRNFVGRQGTGSITHLASPATVAASAIAGCITSSEEYLG